MTRENNNFYTDEEKNAAMSVNIIDYLQHVGYELERSGRKDQQLKIHDSLKIRNDGSVWCWKSRNIGGRSPIELAKQLGIFNGDIVKIIKDMAAFAEGRGYVIMPSYHEYDAAKQKEKETKIRHDEFVLPEKSESAKRMMGYLIQERGIDAEIVFDLYFNKKLIYESEPHHNVVFVGQKNEEGKVLYAGLRGTYTKGKAFKGDTPCSDKSYAFAIPGTGSRLIVCEAPIDALSQATLTKMAGLDWTIDHRIALTCLDDIALERYLKLHPEITELKFCLDNDKDGKNYKGEPENHGQVAAESFMEKYADKGYVVHNYVPIHKDMNEDLKFQLGLLKEEFKLDEVSDKREKNLNEQIRRAKEKAASTVNTEKKHKSRELEPAL